MTIVFVQTGNYAEAYLRFQDGAPEAYRDQKASVDFVADLAAAGEQVCIVALGNIAHDKMLAQGLRSIGLPRAQMTAARASALLDDLQPSRVIVRSPFPEFLGPVRARSLPTLPCFADLFQAGGLRRRVRHWRLRRMLSGGHAPCVANHSLNASRSLVDVLGLPGNRIVPWDWSRITPEPDAKSGPANPTAPRLFFAGALIAAKGVGDCLDALRLLHAQGIAARVSFAGEDTDGRWQAEAARMGLAAQTDFLGRIANTEVRAHMADHDIVVVPSRHDYPEGLPNTIYEALASRSALLLSDHPAFAGRITPDQGCVVFRGGDPEDLARGVTRLCRDPALYARLSRAAPEALAGLYVGLEWSELVTLFLDDPDDSGGWVARHALSALTG